MKETWKDVPGYDGKYQVDMDGNCRRVFPSGKTRPMHPFKKKTSNNGRYVVTLTKDKKKKDWTFAQIMALTFLGPAPKGCVAYHKNGCQKDNYIQNIAYISREELGKLTGARSHRRTVVKINSVGEIVEFYSSAREAGRKNFMSYQTIIDRCNGKCKSAFAPDGFAYAWEESALDWSMRKTIRKIELENGYMPKARNVQFDF